ncbi:MAG: aminotransferase class I/II-fold pyridoxal phosphate-dependent enzyme [Myxococcota bacterium]
MAVRRRQTEGPEAHPLELGPAAMRQMVKLAMDRIVDHVRTLPEQPMHATAGGRKLAALLREPLPDRGQPYERLLRQLFGRIIPASLNTASPGYLAYIPGGGIFHAAVADLIADAVNRYVGVWLAAPGLAQIESNVVDWFRALAGFPDEGGGVLTTGGSMANLMAVITARRERLPENFLSGVLYTSDQAHHSVAKAAMLAGFPSRNVRALPSDESFRIRVDALEDAVASDRRAGLTPFMLVGSAGTTNTGAVDDLRALAEVAQREGLWFHVDAAYGGFFLLTERGRARMDGIERADSVTLDPHKGLFLPYGTGSLIVRDREALRRAHRVEAAYLPPSQTDPELVDFADLSPELSRDLRGLRIWLPFKMHGAGVFRDALDEKLSLAAELAMELGEMPELELVAPPQLSLLAFRLRRPGLSDEERDALGRRLMSAVNQRQRVLLTGTVTHGTFLIRVCVLSFRTHRDRMQMCLEDIRHALKEIQ